MPHQFLSEKMCRLLSSLAPGFEGHWVYGYWGTSKTTSIYCRSAWGITALPENGDKIICPAWQAEDVLKNMTAILLARKTIALTAIHANEIASILYTYPNTAYQKIEEYLWSVLK